MGVVWFVAKLNGYTKSELALFTDILFRYLNEFFSNDNEINPSYCIAVDVVTGEKVSYEDIQNGDVLSQMEATVNEIKGIL